MHIEAAAGTQVDVGECYGWLLQISAVPLLPGPHLAHVLSVPQGRSGGRYHSAPVHLHT
jgi:hypothetical protein